MYFIDTNNTINAVFIKFKITGREAGTVMLKRRKINQMFFNSSERKNEDRIITLVSILFIAQETVIMTIFTQTSIFVDHILQFNISIHKNMSVCK